MHTNLIGHTILTMTRKKLIEIEQKGKVVAKVREVLSLVATASVIGASLVIPTTPIIARPVLRYLKKQQEEAEEKLNYKFDKARLNWLLRRLEDQKMVRLNRLPDDSIEVVLTENGRVKHLQYELASQVSQFSKNKWDGKWRIILFDVPEKNRHSRDQFRIFLKSLKFFKLQKSVYLTPLACEDQIEYLRQFCGLGGNVQILVTGNLENAQAYKLYFGIGD